MNIAKKIKSIVKKETFGTDPRDPWSAKAEIAEDSSLNAYLKSRGINPDFASPATKISYAKSTAFLKWKQQHRTEEVIGETITTEPHITQKKKSELQKSAHAHQEIKTPRGPGSHNEAKGSQTTQLTPEETMDEYSGGHAYFRRTFKNGKWVREPAETPNPQSQKPVKEIANKVKKSALDKFRIAAAEREKKHKEIEKNSGGMTAAIDRLQKQMNKEDVGDSKAAVNADGLPNPQLEPVSEKKRKMSKSASIIKGLYKKKHMKEDLYDHEKEDKSVATYGKKPKEEKADKDESKGEKKPQAGLTLTGGTTLTGSQRDTVEIDPMMRNRPGQPDVTKKDDKKDGKKEDKKKDK